MDAELVARGARARLCLLSSDRGPGAVRTLPAFPEGPLHKMRSAHLAIRRCQGPSAEPAGLGVGGGVRRPKVGSGVGAGVGVDVGVGPAEAVGVVPGVGAIVGLGLGRRVGRSLGAGVTVMTMTRGVGGAVGAGLGLGRSFATGAFAVPGAALGVGRGV